MPCRGAKLPSEATCPGSGTRYERIGHGYARLRREDPRIEAAPGDARTEVNVGAGAGSCEPRDRHVIAVEPSEVMAAQRPPELPPAIRATAGRLPLRDGSVDAAMAILTYLPEVSNRMWLVRDYVP